MAVYKSQAPTHGALFTVTPIGIIPNIDDPGKCKNSILMAFSDNQTLMEEWRAGQ